MSTEAAAHLEQARSSATAAKNGGRSTCERFDRLIEAFCGAQRLIDRQMRRAQAIQSLDPLVRPPRLTARSSADSK